MHTYYDMLNMRYGFPFMPYNHTVIMSLYRDTLQMIVSLSSATPAATKLIRWHIYILLIIFSYSLGYQLLLNTIILCTFIHISSNKLTVFVSRMQSHFLVVELEDAIRFVYLCLIDLVVASTFPLSFGRVDIQIIEYRMISLHLLYIHHA